jgi:hypothetical protein
MVMFSKLGKEVWVLVVILIASLAFSVFYSLNYIQEGLSATEMSPSGSIRTAMQEYKSQVDKNCLGALSKISSVQGISQVESISLSPIVGNENTTNSYKIQQIIGLNTTTKGLQQVLNEVQGQNFTALIGLLRKLSEKTTNETFNNLVAEQFAKMSSMVSETDVSSPYSVIDDYMKSLKAIS